MNRWLILLIVAGSTLGLLAITLGLVAQAAAPPRESTTAVTSTDFYAWGLVISDCFGNPANKRLFAFQEFDGQLYAGTSNYSLEIWRSSDGIRWTPAVTSGLTQTINGIGIDLAVFNGQLYASTIWTALGGVIWRSPNGTDWTLVVPLNGLGQGEYQAFAGMTAFSDGLYVANVAKNIFMEPDHQPLWKTTDGLTWQPITTTGLMSAVVWPLIVFDDHLYAAARYTESGAALWRTDGLTWTAVVTSGFGITQNVGIAGLGMFNDQLYAVTENQATNLQIWRSANGLDWTQVVSGGLGSPPHNSGSGAKLIAFNDNFFLFTGRLMQNNEVYRSADGSKWEQIAFNAWGESRVDPTSGPVAVFRGRLLAGTGNITATTGCQIWSYLTYPCYLPLLTLRN